MWKIILLLILIFLPIETQSQNSNQVEKPAITVAMSQKLARACKRYPKTMGIALSKSTNCQNKNQYDLNLILLEKGSEQVSEKLIIYLSGTYQNGFAKKMSEIGFSSKEIEIANNVVEYKSKIPVATLAMSQKLARACKRYPQTIGKALVICTNSDSASALNWNIALLEDGDEELSEKLLVCLESITGNEFADNLQAIDFNVNEVELAKRIVEHKKNRP